MTRYRLPHIVFSGVVLFWATAANAMAVDDGFGAAKKFDSNYFSVAVAPGVDEGQLTSTLNISPSHKILAGQNLKGAAFAPNDLGGLLDALYIWCASVLDMQATSRRTVLKIARDEQGLKEIFTRLYAKEGFSDKAFYVYETNTLYIAAPDFTKEILGHEVGHAIISNFFVVQPPMKVQEVLAGYIEYQLRKRSSEK